MSDLPLFANEQVQLDSPGMKVWAVTPSDTVDLVDPDTDETQPARALRVKTDGVLVFLPIWNPDGRTITWTVTAGEIVRVRVRRVLSTGTTATVDAIL